MLVMMLLTLLIQPSCHPIRENNAGNFPATLVFGQGGGFSGKYLEYALVSDGTLYKNDLDSNTRVFMKKIRKDDSRSFFVEAESLKLMTLSFNKSSNINYYIMFFKGTRSNKVNWGGGGTPPPEGVKELWERLWAMVR